MELPQLNKFSGFRKCFSKTNDLLVTGKRLRYFIRYEGMNKLLSILLIFVSSCVNSQQKTGEPVEGIPVFAYHRFGDDRFPSTNIDMKVFKDQLNYLKENNYKVLTLDEAIEAIENENVKPKSVVLTVDDGYKSFYENAFPLLQEYGYKVTIFVNTSYVGGNDFMDWDELREISKAGMEIGNHSHEHPHFLNKQNPAKSFREDVLKAQSLFEKHLGYFPGAFSYPYGEYDRTLIEEAREMGFYAATAQRSGVMSPESTFAIPRFPMGGPFATIDGFKRKLKFLPLRIRVHSPQSTTAIAEEFVFSVQDEVFEGSVQCFIDGEKRKLTRNGNNFETAIPESSQRRQLLTVTARHKKSNLYGWSSFLLINTNNRE